MSEKVVLTATSRDGAPLEAIFLPQKGMNLVSYKKGDVQVIDQNTLPLFEERFAGLGALIGPHFHHRRAASLPPIADESLFPHIARVKAKGISEPFSHGIARYAPWQATASRDRVTGRLTGKDLWNGVALSSLEGQNFTMDFTGSLGADGLSITLSVVSDSDSVVGLHYYYNLPNKRGKVMSKVQETFIEGGVKKEIPPEWVRDGGRDFVFDLDEQADYTFYPFPDPLRGEILLDAEQYSLRVSYRSQSQENSWQLYHPKDASFVCIEPLSAQDPRHPNLTVSSISINIEIVHETKK